MLSQVILSFLQFVTELMVRNDLNRLRWLGWKIRSAIYTYYLILYHSIEEFSTLIGQMVVLTH